MLVVDVDDVAPFPDVVVVMRRMHNHMGKMLPEIPDMDTQLALSAKMIDKRQATPKVPTVLHRAVDQHSFFADSDPAVLLNAGPDPASFVMPLWRVFWR